jgi:hypothetical protein
MGSQEIVITDTMANNPILVKTPQELWDEVMTKVNQRGWVTLGFHENEGDFEDMTGGHN